MKQPQVDACAQLQRWKAAPLAISSLRRNGSSRSPQLRRPGRIGDFRVRIRR